MVNELGIWEVAVLTLLREAPMHPYQMQSLLRERHKDEILVLKRGSLYHAIARLLRAALIEVASTGREGRRPERTTYRITEAGGDQLSVTLRQIVSTPRRESSEFMAAMSFLVHLTPVEALTHLETRCERLQAQIEQLDAGLSAAAPHVDRINLVESEYLRAMSRAELAWVRHLAEEVRQGTLTWDIQAIFDAVRLQTKAADNTTDKAKE